MLTSVAEYADSEGVDLVQATEAEWRTLFNVDVQKSLPQVTDIDKRPLFYNQRWWLPVNGETLIPGRLFNAPKKKNRLALEFYLPEGKTKKFYYCEFCFLETQRTEWIFHKNFVHQHIPRWHQHACDYCSRCKQYIFREIFCKHKLWCGIREKETTQKSLCVFRDFVPLNPDAIWRNMSLRSVAVDSSPNPVSPFLMSLDQPDPATHSLPFSYRAVSEVTGAVSAYDNSTLAKATRFRTPRWPSLPEQPSVSTGVETGNCSGIFSVSDVWETQPYVPHRNDDFHQATQPFFHSSCLDAIEPCWGRRGEAAAEENPGNSESSHYEPSSVLLPGSSFSLPSSVPSLPQKGSAWPSPVLYSDAADIAQNVTTPVLLDVPFTSGNGGGRPESQDSLDVSDKYFSTDLLPLLDSPDFGAPCKGKPPKKRQLSSADLNSSSTGAMDTTPSPSETAWNCQGVLPFGEEKINHSGEEFSRPYQSGFVTPFEPTSESLGVETSCLLSSQPGNFLSHPCYDYTQTILAPNISPSAERIDSTSFESVYPVL